MNPQEAIRAATERIVLPPKQEPDPVDPTPIADAIETAVRVGRHRA